MAMGTVNAVNIQTGTQEGAKFVQVGDVTEIWSAALTTALASGDTIVGPTIPPNCYVCDVQVSLTRVDTGATQAFNCGYLGALAAFISGSTIGQSGNIAHMNVPAGMGYFATTSTQILVTMTATAAIPVAGTIVILVTYTASP